MSTSHPTSVGYTIALQLVLLVDKKTYDLRSMSQWRANIFYSVVLVYSSFLIFT